MKKLVLSLVVLAFLAVSCGPSAKELEDKRIADSIVMADSIAMVQAAQQKIADSIANAQAIADSAAAKAPKKGKK